MRRAIAVLALGCGLACASGLAREWVVVADSAVIAGGAWTRFAAPRPLATPAYHHEVCFEPVAPARLAEQPMGILDGDGTPVTLQVEVSGPGGALVLPLSGYSGRGICYGVRDARLDARFDEVALFASRTLAVRGLAWSSTDK